MNFRRLTLMLGIPALLMIFFSTPVRPQFSISNGRAIAAYGLKGGYLITSLNELMQWNDVSQKWCRLMTLTPAIRQMDTFTDGTKLMGTDNTGQLWLWNGNPAPGGNWTEQRVGKTYDWVILDPISEERRGLISGLPEVWESWDAPASASWNQHIPIGPEGAQKLKSYFLVNSKTTEFCRWERGDFGYRVALNREGGATPFKILAYAEKEDTDQYYSKPVVLNRMIEPPMPTPYLDTPTDDVTDPDLVIVRQISYDEVEQNLWAIDTNGWPWHWNNEYQGWELRRERCEAPYVPPVVPLPQCYEKLRKIIACNDDYYIRTTYIDGDYKPLLIIFKDQGLMHLVLGELSKGDMSELRIHIVEEPRRAHKFHNIKQLPFERPQKLVRLDGGTRTRENGYLEQLLTCNGIIARHEDLGAYPVEHRLVRR